MKKFSNAFIVVCIVVCCSSSSFANQKQQKYDNNTTLDSFNKAKKYLEQIYEKNNKQRTLYCDLEYSGKDVILPENAQISKYAKRFEKIEWEHVVPAENFGRNFTEWREGDPSCVDSKGKSFKGRNCASKMNKTYRYMQSDMHNLFPAIGGINAIRQNFNFEMLGNNAKKIVDFCDMKVDGRKVEPPVHARGPIARAYKYMDAVYDKYKMSSQTKKLMDAWDNMHPPTEWECKREQEIAAIQGNHNMFVYEKCK